MRSPGSALGGESSDVSVIDPGEIRAYHEFAATVSPRDLPRPPLQPIPGQRASGGSNNAMPDDGPRPLQENSPGQSNDAPPAWWGDLGRADLPDDKGRQSVWLTLDAIPAPPPARRPHRWMARVVNALVFVAVVIAATLIAIVPENRSKLWALIGIPVLAGALLGVALAVFRRGRF